MKRPVDIIFPELKREKNIKKRICVFCRKKIPGFKDDISLKEFMISCLCQDCQDKFFRKG